MPYKIIKLQKYKTLYKVINSKTKQVHSYKTTLKKAQAQVRLLRMMSKD